MWCLFWTHSNSIFHFHLFHPNGFASEGGFSTKPAVGILIEKIWNKNDCKIKSSLIIEVWECGPVD